jgi:hypothetical protein
VRIWSIHFSAFGRFIIFIYLLLFLFNFQFQINIFFSSYFFDKNDLYCIITFISTEHLTLYYYGLFFFIQHFLILGVAKIYPCLIEIMKLVHWHNCKILFIHFARNLLSNWNIFFLKIFLFFLHLNNFHLYIPQQSTQVAYCFEIFR